MLGIVGSLVDIYRPQTGQCVVGLCASNRLPDKAVHFVIGSVSRNFETNILFNFREAWQSDIRTKVTLSGQQFTNTNLKTGTMLRQFEFFTNRGLKFTYNAQELIRSPNRNIGRA